MPMTFIPKPEDEGKTYHYPWRLAEWYPLGSIFTDKWGVQWKVVHQHPYAKMGKLWIRIST